jgi:hypothetical protein
MHIKQKMCQKDYFKMLHEERECSRVTKPYCLFVSFSLRCRKPDGLSFAAVSHRCFTKTVKEHINVDSGEPSLTI